MSTIEFSGDCSFCPKLNHLLTLSSSFNPHKIEIGLEGFGCIDLVAPFGVQNPIPDKRLRLPRILGIVHPHMDELLTGLKLLRPIHGSFINIPDLAKTPSGDVGEV